MPRLHPLALVLALGTGCLATASAHESLKPSGAGKVVFVVLMPALIAIDIATAPFQFWYVITHAR